MPVEVSKTDGKDCWVRAFFGVAALVVAVGLLGVRTVAFWGLREAATWRATPCTIERSEFVRDDDGRYLVLEYRYEVAGVSYRGDRLDMLPGRMGDDEAWEEKLHDGNPKGALGICYVDPDRPERSVADPKHGGKGARNLLLLALPLLAISAALLISVGWTLTRHRSARAARMPGAPTIQPPPRRLGLGQRIALLQASKQTLMAWAFLVGFVIVFRMLEGPAHVRDLFPRAEVTVEGQITRVAPAQQREFGQDVYEFSFDYEYAGRKREGLSYVASRQYAVDDKVNVIINPTDPDQARIEGTRQRMVPFWVVMVPGAVIVLLALGIAASHLASLRSWKLARNGAVAEATLVDAGDPGVANPLTRHEFVVDDKSHQVDARSALPPSLERCYVLYEPGAPDRNLGLSLQQTAVLTGSAATWKGVLMSLLPPAVGAATVVWILSL